MGLAGDYRLYYYNWGGGGGGGSGAARRLGATHSFSALENSSKPLRQGSTQRITIPRATKAMWKKKKKQLIGRVDTAYTKDGWVGKGWTDKPNIVAYFAPEFSDTTKIERPAPETFQYLLLFPAPCFVDISTFTFFTWIIIHLVHPPQFCITIIVSKFSWVLQSSQEKSKTIERLSLTYTANGKRQIRVENFSR